MLRLGDDKLLLVWEAGRWASPPSRTLLLHAAARPEISADERADIPLAERDAVLLELHGALFGDRMPCFVACPQCRAQLEFEMSAHAVQQHTAAHSGEGLLEWRCGDWRVQFRLPTSRDVGLLESCSAVADARALLASRCVIHAERDGSPVAAGKLAEAQLNALSARMAECDPGGDLRISLRCAGCGHVWESLLDAGNFLWAEVSAYARRLLREVHTLAHDYGWSESEILRMSSARRNMYLELVANE